MSIHKVKSKYTYQDYCTWPDEERWEIIDGVPYNMTPAPTTKHQTIALHIGARLNTALNGKSCTPFISPIDVVLSDYNVVQPDIIVVCDPKKITEKNIQGAPDLIIEILSPSTSAKDRREKKVLYERSGVREYILIDPEGQYAERFTLQAEDHFSHSQLFDAQQTLVLTSLEGLEIPLWEIFEVERQSKRSEPNHPVRASDGPAT